jgi:prepilin-type N-terminal cleavage/methylation domain-containing protein
VIPDNSISSRFVVRPRVRDERSGSADDSGFTLVEVLIAMMLFGVLLAMTVPIVSTLFRTTAYVNNSYSNENQLLPIGTSFQNLIRSVVEPAPNLSSGQPVPAYGTYSTYAGSPNAVAGTTPTPTSMTFFTNVGSSFGSRGPAKVTAQLTGTTFTVSVAIATGNCPGLTAGTACTWSATPRTLFTVKNVVNPVSTPIFTYTVAGTNYSTATADTTEFST